MFGIFRNRKPNAELFDKAMEGYHSYRPPHLKEERTLSKQEAHDNFVFFLENKSIRLDLLTERLDKWFGMQLKFDDKSIKDLNGWMFMYSDFLLQGFINKNNSYAYFDYSEKWENDFVGLNAVFDIGIYIGETFIHNHPKVKWAFDPTSEILPRTAKRLKKDRGSSYQRPEITGGDNPAWSWSPLHDSYMYLRSMHSYKKKEKYRIDTKIAVPSIYSQYKGISGLYSGFDLKKELNSQTLETYLRSIDNES